MPNVLRRVLTLVVLLMALGSPAPVLAKAAETGKKIFTFQTVAGILNAVEHEDGTISVDMGKPVFAWDKIPLAHHKMWKNEHAPGNMAVLVYAPRTGLRTYEDVAEALGG